MAYLRFIKNGPPDPVLVGDRPMTIGRAPKCDIPVDDGQLSREHCRVAPDEDTGGFSVTDLASANGTKLNNEPVIGTQPLKEGDLVTIGGTRFAFVATLEAAQKIERLPDGVANGPPTGLHLKLYGIPEGSSAPAYIQLGTTPLTLGRKEGADIVLRHTGVSGRHCELVPVEPGVYRIRDLGSTNGVRVNGEKVRDVVLKPGDQIALDKVLYTVVMPGVSGSPGGDSGPRLLVKAGTLGIPAIPLGSAVITLGRKADNTHPLADDTEVSGHHARIESKEGRHVLTDLGSTNGTRVNGENISGTHILAQGDEIGVGKTLLIYSATATGGQEGFGPDRTQMDALAFKDADALDPTELNLKAMDGPAVEEVVRQRPAAEGHVTDEEAREFFGQEDAAFFQRHGDGKPSRGRLTGVLDIVFSILLLLAMGGAVAFAVWSGGPSRVNPESTEPVPPPAESLLKTNWSFEEESAGELAGWIPGFYVSEDIQDSLYRSDAAAHSGQSSLEIGRTGDDYRATDVYAAELIDLQTESGQILAGLTIEGYLLLGTGAGMGTSGAGFVVEWFEDPMGQTLVQREVSSYRRGASEWREHQFISRTPVNAQYARVGCSVVGTRGSWLFDDITVKPSTAEELEQIPVREDNPPLLELTDGTEGGLAWQVRPDGIARLVRQTDGVPIAMDVEVAFSSLTGSISRGWLAEVMRHRRLSIIDRDGSQAIQLIGFFVDPLSRRESTAENLPESRFEIQYGFADGQAFCDVRLFEPLTGMGIVARLPGIGAGPSSRQFAEDDAVVWEYEPLPIKGPGDQRIAFRQIVLPWGTGGHLGLSTPEGDGPRVRIDMDGRVALMDLWFAGSSATQNRASLAVQTQFQAERVAELRRQQQEALASEAFGTAAQHTLAWLALRLHDPAAIKQAASAVSAIAARFQFRIQEYQRSLDNLRNNPSREMFRQVTRQGEELEASIAEANFEALNIGDLSSSAFGPLVAEDIRSILRDVSELIRSREQIRELRAARRVDIDIYTMTRWEDESARLLARARDFDTGGHETMAATVYAEVLRAAPVSRPATAAREALLDRAETLLADAASEAGTAGLDMAALALRATTFILADRWRPEGPGTALESFWTEAGAFSSAAQQIIGNFMGRRLSGAPADASPWRDWDRDTWAQHERQVRLDALALRRQIESSYPSLVEGGEAGAD